VKGTVFIGGGRITSALLAGLRLAGYDRRLVVHDRHSRKMHQLSKQYGVEIASDLQSALYEARLLIIAVRPSSVADLLRDMGPIDRPLLGVSLAAGIPLSRLQSSVGSLVRWARAMPSPVCRFGHGLTSLTFARNFPRSARRDLRNFFAKVGQVIEVPETQFDAITVTFSSSHGYHALETLASAAEGLGLPREIALTAAAHALCDGVLAWRESNLSLRDLLNEAATPGGIAAEVINTMDKAGYSKAIREALAAGMARARKNADRS
jgi:pyrroline-5-carboxylate reductase